MGIFQLNEQRKKLKLVSISQAAKEVNKTTSNIRYYINYNRIAKYNIDGVKLDSKASNGELRVSLMELKKYLDSLDYMKSKHHHAGLNSELGFYNLAERDRTKHVHRLHPYLGKFIPQLVEWFLRKYFTNNDIILDPFMGAGTTLVQGNEMGLHTIGIDVSEFNCMISKVKTSEYDLVQAKHEILDAENELKKFSLSFDTGSSIQLIKSIHKDLDNLKDSSSHSTLSDYLNEWFAERTLLEMLYYKNLITNYNYQDLLRVLLSRAVRSSRMIPHYDLATPKAPLKAGVEYWCRKHNRNCKPVTQLFKKVHNYSLDTYRRIHEFSNRRSDKEIIVLNADSQEVNLTKTLNQKPFDGRKIDEIFTSPPYVGQIDYHDQHIYAYELFDIPRNDKFEIGPKKSGKSKKAQQDYIDGISNVFINVSKYLKDDAKIFIVANDKLGLYPRIAEKSNFKIITEHQRAVTKRTEQGDNPYYETIFL